MEKTGRQILNPSLTRISLSKSSSSDTYFILDRFDNKKIGKLLVKKDKIKVKLKEKYKNKSYKTEAKSLFLHPSADNWLELYWQYLKKTNKVLMNIDEYSFPIHFEAGRLKRFKKDIFNRDIFLHPLAGRYWKKMKKAAKKDGIKLQIISAFRSIQYQKKLILNKINKGQKLEEILKVNVLPGFSEHHTGFAIDLTSKGEVVLEEEFEKSDAFYWLVKNANQFGFYLSYPRNNSTGVIYEPWHWCFQSDF